MKNMKKMKSIKSMLLIGAMAVSVSVLYYSCTKPSPGVSLGEDMGQDNSIAQAKSFADKISHIKIVADNGKVLGMVNGKTGAFSFADPHEGFHFSTNNGWEFVEDGSGGTVYIAAGGFGNNAGGGMVIAGSTTMEINYTFCLSASDDASGVNFFGPSKTGVSLIMGISGNLEKLLKGEVDSNTEMEDIFNGFAMYIVYSDKASGNYDVVNWITDSGLSDLENKNKGFAWVMDFKNFHLYFSKEGKLNVNGGSIGFDGKYLDFQPDASASDLFDFGDNPKVTEVDGMGIMGCN